jgi:hypothetical protein
MSHHPSQESHHPHAGGGDVEKEAESFLNNKSVPKISAGLLLFYLALLGNYTGDLIPPDLAKFINRSRIAQHFIAFIVLLFTINLYSENQPFQKVLLYSFLLWLWFLFTSKQHLAVSITIIVLLIVSYSAFNFSEDLQYEKQLSQAEKEKKKKILTIVQNVCFYLILFVAVIGGTSYFIEHYKEYGEEEGFGTFMWKFFLMGKGKKASS